MSVATTPIFVLDAEHVCDPSLPECDPHQAEAWLNKIKSSADPDKEMIQLYGALLHHVRFMVEAQASLQLYQNALITLGIRAGGQIVLPHEEIAQASGQLVLEDDMSRGELVCRVRPLSEVRQQQEIAQAVREVSTPKRPC